MSATLRKWLPIALCCLPGIALAGLVGIGLAAGGTAFGAAFGGPVGLTVIGLAVLACPASMGLMMLRQRRSDKKPGRAASTSLTVADCCLPGQPQADAEAASLAALRTRRETLERELAELQAR
jgi:hypothetical protein